MTALASWRDTPTRAAIVEFVEAVSGDGPRHVPVERRVAVLDNDGTLWTEKPMPVELGFILQRLAAMADQDPTLRDQQPWKAAHEGDHAWLGKVVTDHYQGDDSGVKVLIGGLLKAFDGMPVEEYVDRATVFLDHARHPSLDRDYRDCGFLPMVELLGYLADHDFTCYIASAGDRDFMRVISNPMYGIPPERVIGSSNALRYEEDDHGGAVVYESRPDFFDDGPVKPVRIWSRTGQRPILSVGNANGDLPMLRFTGGRDLPALRMLVRHDDADREFAYTAGSEQALDEAAKRGWPVISVRDDWSTVFAETP
ncbi:acid phosphatase [Actinophytocola xinjiangensis]|uniref:Acid phosphatase n=1 Tax=Actinophytocola xinjiangensis TaxID=485602 RepID=A0A7Z0WGF0_9PSEU|nr:haloacid dehalogenase-like hydrolase [Actinophytocola xinjiangensis]OLF06646.1 acid phosphatase [Actinophytocola xinjiangensis]